MLHRSLIALHSLFDHPEKYAVGFANVPPGLAARLRGRRILDLRYQAEDGFVVIALEGGWELWVSADWEGCQVFGQDLSAAATKTKAPNAAGTFGAGVYFRRGRAHCNY